MLDIVLRTDAGAGLQQEVVGLRGNELQGMGAGAIKGVGETGAKKGTSLEKSLSDWGCIFGIIQDFPDAKEAFLRGPAGGGDGDVAHTVAFQHHSQQSLVSTQLVHRLFKE